MDISKLKQELPHKWRVQSFSKQKPQASCVAYIDARDVMDVLDSVCGPENWQDDFKVIDGTLYAGIGIRFGDEWIWKWDAGTESEIEKQKGQSSDAFKRAGVKWGIGRFLYSLGNRYVSANEKKANNNSPFVIDSRGNRVWDLTAHINGDPTTSQNEGSEEADSSEDKPASSKERTRFYSGMKAMGFDKAASDQLVLDELDTLTTAATKDQLLQVFEVAKTKKKGAA